MTLFHGPVGYGDSGRIVDDVWRADITERDYYGEVLEEARSLEPSDKVNDNIRISNRIRIMADAFAFENFSTIKYVLWNGVRWKVTTVAIQRPRLLLTLGEVYDGPGPT